MDVERVRADFPLLERSFHGQRLAYLDSAATSQKPRAVIEAVAEFYAERNANVHRGVYALSEEATEAYERARERVARFVHASDPSEIVFVRGTTEALNLAATSLGRSILEKGDTVLTTVMEHHSNIVPWQLLRDYAGTRLDFVDIDEEGRLRMDQYDQLLSPRTRVVTLTHASNVLGTVNPVKEVAERAHAQKAVVIVDAAQSVPHQPIDVQRLGCDLLAFSGHKTLGPTGIGVLWGRKDLLAKMPPYMGGGEMIREVHTDRVSFADPPARFEAGTPNVAGAIGLGAALEYLEKVGWEQLANHERYLTDRCRRALDDTFGERLHVFGPLASERREAILSFQLAHLHPHDIASLLDEAGVAIRSGHHCAQPLMERLKVAALSRASFYLYNTAEEVDRLVAALVRAERKMLGQPVPVASLRTLRLVGGRDGRHCGFKYLEVMESFEGSG
ncbi:MAG: cysteine desulfurase [Thermoplasmata archaeon]|nr:cysteine desulfurase [Thermoplasmata archaeon]